MQYSEDKYQVQGRKFIVNLDHSTRVKNLLLLQPVLEKILLKKKGKNQCKEDNQQRVVQHGKMASCMI